MADVGPRQFSGGMNDYALSYKTVPCHLCVLSVLQKKKPHADYNCRTNGLNLQTQTSLATLCRRVTRSFLSLLTTVCLCVCSLHHEYLPEDGGGGGRERDIF